MRSIPRKSPPPFVIGTTVFQSHSSAKIPSLKAAWMRDKNFFQFVVSVFSSRVAFHMYYCIRLALKVRSIVMIVKYSKYSISG